MFVIIIIFIISKMAPLCIFEITQSDVIRFY